MKWQTEMPESALHESNHEILGVDALSGLSEFISARMGLYFPKQRWADLERGINSVAREFGFKDAQSCAQWLISAPLSKDRIETLASHLTVGETFFFRDGRYFEVLQGHILPELLRLRAARERNIRIWSAGCSTGEEPYSIAIALHRNIPDIEDWNITIQATDINSGFLRQAQEGVYDEWSFRGTPRWVRENYFRKTIKGFRILDHIKRMITFSYHNMIEDPYPSLLNNTNAMDIVFCRNMLMYFSREKARQVINNLWHCLVDNGWLIVSPVETSQVLLSQFRMEILPGAIVYRKEVRSPDLKVERETALPLPPLKITPPVPPPLLKTRGGRGSYDSEGDEGGVVPTGDERGIDAGATAFWARSYANQGRLSEALALCERAIASDKTSPALHYLHATILQEQGRTEEAATSLRRTLYIDRDFVPAHFMMGNLMQRKGRSRESRKHLQIALSLLSSYRYDDVLPESEGMSAGRLGEIIETMLEAGLRE